MSKKFDAEDLLDMLLSIMKDNGALNTKIAAIDAEKPGTFTSVAIDTAAYFEQTWSDAIMNKSPAIFYGIENVDAIDGGGVVAKTYECFAEIVLVDSGQDALGSRRIARYSRALEELFATTFQAAAEVGKVKIKSVRPLAFKLEMDSSEEIRVGGISIQITLV